MQAIEVNPIYIDTAIVISNGDMHPYQQSQQLHQQSQQQLQQQQLQQSQLPCIQNADRLLILAYVAKHVKFIQRRKVYIPRF